MLTDGLRLTDNVHARFYAFLGVKTTNAARIGKPFSVVLGDAQYGDDLARNAVKSPVHELDLVKGFAYLNEAEHQGVYYEIGIKDQAGDYIAVGRLPAMTYQQTEEMQRSIQIAVVMSPSVGDIEKRDTVPTPPHEVAGHSIIHWGSGAGAQEKEAPLPEEKPPVSSGSIPVMPLEIYAPLRIKQTTQLGIGLPLINMPIRLSPGIYIHFNNYTRFLTHGD